MEFDLQPSTATSAARCSCLRSRMAGWKITLCLLAMLGYPATLVFAQNEQQPQLRMLPRHSPADVFLAEKLAQPGDLTLRKTSLPEALFAIGELWGLNLVVGEEVQGQVNCDFQNAPLSEILNTVLLSNGYSYRPFGRSLVIVRLADMGDVNPLFETATIPVRFGDPADLVEGASVFNSPRGKTKAISSARSLLVVDYPDRVAMIREFVAGLNSSSDTSATGAGESELQTLQLQPQYVPALMLKDALGAVLSKEGKVIVIDGENRVVAVDYPYYLRLARQVMDQVDRPRPQVRITAYIYDVGLQDFETLGLNWNNALKGSLDGNGDPQSSWAIDTLTKVPFDGGAVGGAMTFFNMSDNFDLRATINALNTCKDSRLLADPNVVVVDNESATVAIISEIPFQQLTQTGQGGNIGTTAFREAGVKLNVLPRIAEDGTIQMVVEPEFSRLTGFTPESQQPIIDRRSAKTTVRVMNGQTVVIGGLRQRTDVGTFNGIPFLKDIPYLGVLFRSRETDVRESELIVFIKPEIVDYAEMLRCREVAALGTSHKYLDQIPIGETPVQPLPEVNPQQQGPQQPGQPGQWEEVPPPAATKQTPKTVEQSSQGLALSAQRGRNTYDTSARHTWQQTTGGSPSLQPPATSTNTSQAVASQSREGFRRLPPVQSEPVAVAAPTTYTSDPNQWRYGNWVEPQRNAAPDTRQMNATPTPAANVPVRDYRSVPAPRYASQVEVPANHAPVNQAPVNDSIAPTDGPTSPVNSTEPASPNDSAPPADDSNPLRTRGYRLNDPDEVRSASWINNVFRY